MLTSTPRTAAARLSQPATQTARRLPPLASLAVILLIVCSGLLGLIVLYFRLYIPALLFFTLSVGLAMGRQVVEQLRLANTRSEEMTHELRLIRHGLSARSLTPEARDLPGSLASAPFSPGDLPR
jgi:hypothetical protein